MPSRPVTLSHRASLTKDQPISWFMQQAVENPDLISLAAGLVDAESLPGADIAKVAQAILSDPASAKAALQYGTTPGHAPLRDKIVSRLNELDHRSPGEAYLADDVVVTTGSQQLLYLLGELLLDPGDIVLVEAPSYFVFHGVLASLGVRALQIPMDDDGMIVDALEDRLRQLERTGELPKVKMIYTVDYFQNPTGLTLSLPRRAQLVDVARRWSKHHRILILEDAAYRELRYEGDDLPSIMSFDESREHVLLAMTFSKPMAPGLKTGYGILPNGIAAALARFKGNHDFGSSNLNQHILDRLIANGAYDRHVAHLQDVYRHKRDAMLHALKTEFPAVTGTTWTYPKGGLYVWWKAPEGMETGPKSPLMRECLKQGILYVPGEFAYVEDGPFPRNEARLSFGVEQPDRIREGIERLAHAAREVGLPRIHMPRVAGCRG